MKSRVGFLVVASLALPGRQLPEKLQRRFENADRETIRLAAAAFPRLPKNLVQELQRRGCTVPQVYGTKRPHNVVRGHFARPAQTDWAVLCSRDRVSSILVFWNGSEQGAAELARQEDKGYLQGIGGDEIGFSRMISAAGRAAILRHYQGRGIPDIPLDHQGIDDAFVEKASVVHYFYRGKWLRLLGAD